ncbi:MAG: hemolysin family protein [Alphaproteobacteria bacterium]|nr:hemolysin family protein [Alphaproteobacteria bacterium]
MADGPDDADPASRPRLRDRLARLVSGRALAAPEPLPAARDASPGAIRLRIAEFEGANVRDVMTSRVDVAAVEIDATLQEVLNRFARDAHSRMPVYRDSIDDAVGFVHIKDVVAEIARAGLSPETLACQPLERLMRDIMFVPQSMRLPDLLVQMQSTRIHIALVVDEYGGIGGVVCLEDLVEQIVGEIDDEHDVDAPPVVRKGRSSWEVDGLALIDDVERETGLVLSVAAFEDEIDTIGGLASAVAGRVPQVGDVVEHPHGPVMEIVEADPRRVIRIRLRGAPRTAPAPAAELKAAEIDRQGA